MEYCSVIETCGKSFSPTCLALLTRYQDEGPLELTRRNKVLVWSEEIEIPEDAAPVFTPPSDPASSNSPASPPLPATVPPHPKRVRSQSYGSEFPPPMRRTSTDVTGTPRPVPFTTKFQRVHPGTTGVTVLEHLEKLDAVEASLQRLGGDGDDSEVVTEEVDVGEAIRPPKMASAPAGTSRQLSSPFSPPGSPLATVHEVSSRRSSIDEEDLVALSKSTSHVEGSSRNGQPGIFSTAGIDWIQHAENPGKKIVIAEASLPLNYFFCIRSYFFSDWKLSSDNHCALAGRCW